MVYQDHPVACSDDNVSIVVKTLPDEHFPDSGIPQKLRTQKTAWTPHTQAESGCNLWHPAIGYCAEVRVVHSGPLTTRNPTCGIWKPKMDTSASKYFETGIISLLAADNQNKECASAILLEGFLSKGWICLVKYPSLISVTMDPESSSDGTSRPNRSIGMAGHWETALLISFCFTSELTVLDNVWTRSSYFVAGIGDFNGSTSAPLPWPCR